MLELLKRRRIMLWEIIHSYNSTETIPTALYESIMDELLQLDYEISTLEYEVVRDEDRNREEIQV